MLYSVHFIKSHNYNIKLVILYVPGNPFFVLNDNHVQNKS